MLLKNYFKKIARTNSCSTILDVNTNSVLNAILVECLEILEIVHDADSPTFN